jgi:hypothetical protein
MSAIKIIKADSSKPVLTIQEPQTATSRPVRKATMKTYPKGVLKKTAKIKPVRDPAKAPPFKKGVRKHSVRVLTEKGIESRRKTIRIKIKSMKDDEVQERLRRAKVSHNPKTPPHVLRDILEGGMEAGMISSD